MPVLVDTNAKMVAVSTTEGKVCVHHGRNEATTTTVVLVSTTIGRKLFLLAGQVIASSTTGRSS